MKKIFLRTSIVCILAFSSILFASKNIIVKNNNLYPEGISYNAKDKNFIVSSVGKGEIWSVAINGDKTLFAKDKRIISAIGLLVDAKNNRLLVCVGDPGVGNKSSDKTRGKLAALAVFDLSTKKEIAYYDLASLDKEHGHLANDVTIDNKGNIYVTDSFSPSIYKIDTHGKATIWVNANEWRVKPGQFGLNGIVCHPSGFIIVAHYQTKSLYKIDINHPKNIQTIKIANNILNAIDGMLLLNSTTLLVVSNNISGAKEGNGVYKLTSTDNFKTLNLTADMKTDTTFPTTLTRIDDNVYLMHSQLLELFSGNKHPVENFEIQKVSFK